jgi:hypothetical protein
LAKLPAAARIIAYVERDSVRRQAVVDRTAASVLLERAGATLSIENAGDYWAAIKHFEHALFDDLASSTVIDGSSVIVSPEGDAVPMHFDSITTLCVHLSGSKRWWVSRNEHASAPSFVYFVTEGGGGPRSPYKIPYEAPIEKFAKEMPDDAMTFDMEPGSVACIPPGWWHQTKALSPTIAIIFRIKCETVAGIVQRVLTNSPEAVGNRPVPALYGPDTEVASRQARAAIADAIEYLRSLADAEMLRSVRGRVFSRKARFEVDHTTRIEKIYTSPEAKPATITLIEPQLQAMQWLVERDTTFEETEFLRAAAGLSAADAAQFLRVLVDNAIVHAE